MPQHLIWVCVGVPAVLILTSLLLIYCVCRLAADIDQYREDNYGERRS